MRRSNQSVLTVLFVGLLMAVVSAATVLLLVNISDENASGVPLREYYPSDKAEQYYLEGTNFLLDPPARSVLWFEVDGDSFQQHNWGPEDIQGGCNTDYFEWGRELLYTRTSTTCDGQSIATTYSPGIVYMPALLYDESWNTCGTSSVSHTEDGEVVRSGTVQWCSSVNRVDSFYEVTVDIHTRWDDGWPTDWVEKLVLSDVGLISHEGGNQDGSFNWRVIFDRWDDYGTG